MLFYIIVIVFCQELFYHNYFFEKGNDNKYTIVCQTPMNIGSGIGVRLVKSGFTAVQSQMANGSTVLLLRNCAPNRQVLDAMAETHATSGFLAWIAYKSTPIE